MSVQEWEEKAQVLADQAGRDCSLEEYIERLEAMSSVIQLCLDAAEEDQRLRSDEDEP